MFHSNGLFYYELHWSFFLYADEASDNDQMPSTSNDEGAVVDI